MSLLSRCRVASCALLLLLAVALAPAADALPRYKLQVGQELQYTCHTEFKYDGGKFLDDTDARLWVVRQNDDGTWRVIVRRTIPIKHSPAATWIARLTTW